jgi:hypothetical protein
MYWFTSNPSPNISSATTLPISATPAADALMPNHDTIAPNTPLPSRT